VLKLRIYTLGRKEVFLEGESVERFDTDKIYALLVYLGVEAKRPHRRGHLAGLLWTDQPEEHALHSLRQALSGLRKTLGEKKEKDLHQSDIPLILSIKDLLQINPERKVWLDCRDFEDHLALAYLHYQGC
jgi:DNA-binding SARP family transcriptional activator